MVNEIAGDPPSRGDDDAVADESRRVWQDGPSERIHLTKEFFHARLAKAARAHRRLRLLRAIQHVGGAGGLLGSVVMSFAFSDAWMRLGSIGLASTFLYRLWVLRRTPLLSDGAGPLVDAEPSLIAYRSALLRRVADDSGPQLWSRFAIGVPAAALFLYGFARSYPALAPVIALEAVATAIGLTTAFVIALRRARRCQAELDVLDALDRETRPVQR